jgi:hypothetical protein
MTKYSLATRRPDNYAFDCVAAGAIQDRDR